MLNGIVCRVYVKIWKVHHRLWWCLHTRGKFSRGQKPQTNNKAFDISALWEQNDKTSLAVLVSRSQTFHTCKPVKYYTSLDEIFIRNETITGYEFWFNITLIKDSNNNRILTLLSNYLSRYGMVLLTTCSCR